VAESRTAAGWDARAWETLGDGDAGGSSSALARRLVELETALEAEPPEAVVVADDSDTALAGALVAAKLLIPVEVDAEAGAGTSLNARLIGQLASG
jgi:hypothetical protein